MSNDTDADLTALIADARANAESARLTTGTPLVHDVLRLVDAVERLTRERDDARAENEQLRGERDHAATCLVFCTDPGPEPCSCGATEGDTAADPTALIADARASTWADASAILNDHADVWKEDGSDPCRVRICREMANAFRTYAEGVGTPSIDTLRRKRRAAEAEVADLRTRLADAEATTQRVRGLLDVQHDEFGQPWPWVAGFRRALDGPQDGGE